MAADFIKEKIKDKPVNKRRIAAKFLFTVFLAVIFGAVAAFTYIILMTGFSGLSGFPGIPGFDLKARAEIVRIPEDEEIPVSDNVILSENILPEEETEPIREIQAETVSEDAPLKQDGRRTVVNYITNQMKITPAQYEHVFNELRETVRDTERCLVTVTGTVSDTDWFENTFENSSHATGVILADNNREVLILTSGELIQDADVVSVTFCNGFVAEARRVKEDTDTELCVIGVRLNDVPEATREAISMARLGNSSRPNMVGKPVIAIGSPLGNPGSQIYGVVTSDSAQEQFIDRNLHLLTTDIYGSTNASGVLVDYEGSILGIITNQYPQEGIENLITAYSISDIKSLLEKLANSQEMAYLGIYGTDVGEETAESLGVPQGAYVTGAVSGSPAMGAGIQGGDVIVKFGTSEIRNFSDYMKVMEKCQPGEETVISVQRYVRGEYSEMTFEVTLAGDEEK